MADVIIHIKALDLTGPAVKSAQENLRRLTTQSRVDAASKNIQEAFKNLVRGVDAYAKQSATVLALEVNRRQRAIRTMEAMETRFRLHIMKEVSETERHRMRERLRTVSSYKSHLNQELSALKSALKQKDSAEAAAHKAHQTRERERAREDDRIRKAALAAAKSYNRQIEEDEKRAAERRKAIAGRLKNARSGVFASANRVGFESLFAGVSMGSQAGMLGSSLGGAMGGLGSELAGGITSLAGMVPKVIAIATKGVSVAVRAVGTVASLGVSALTTLYSIAAVGIPKIGILITGALTGVGSLVSGVLRGATDIAAGAVELIGGALEGMYKTVQEIVGDILGVVGGLIKTVVGSVAGVIGKALGMVGEAFMGLLSVATSTFEKMMAKNVEFGKQMADVFTQVPEYGIAGFKKLEDKVNEIFRKLPLARGDISKGLFEIVSTKLTKNPEEAGQVLEGVSRAAVAGGSDANVFDTAKAATAVLSAFRMEAKDTEATLSKMFKAAAEGRFSFGDLAEGIQNVAGIAANFGESLDDLLASFVLASQSMAKQTTPVGVKNLILSLASPTAEAEKQLHALGISFKEYTKEELESIQAGKKLIEQLKAQIKAFEAIEKKTHNQKLALKEMKRALREAKEDEVDLERASGKFIGVIPSVKKIAALGLSPAQERGIVPERRALAALQAIKSELDRADETLGEIAADTGQQMGVAFGIQFDTLESRMKVMANTFDDLFTDPFKFLEPSFKRVVAKITERLPGLRDQIAKQLTFDKESAQRMMGEWLDGVVDTAFDAGEYVANNWREIADKVVDAWKQVEIVFKAIQEVAKAGGMVMKDVFGIDSADAFAKAMKAAGDAANEVWEAIKKISEGDLSPIINVIDAIKVAWAELTDFMRSSLANVIEGMQAPATSLINQLHDAMLMATNPVDAAFSSHKPSQLASSRRASKSLIEQSIAGDSPISRALGKAAGRDLSPEERSSVASGFLSRVQAEPMSVYPTGSGSTSIGGFDRQAVFMDRFLQNAMRELGLGEGGMKGMAALEDAFKGMGKDYEVFKEAVGAFAIATKGLGAFGIKGMGAQDTAFQPIDVSGVVKDLRVPTAPGVKEKVEADKIVREQERLTKELTKVMGDLVRLLVLDPTGVSVSSAPKGSGTGGLHAKKASKTKYHDETTENEVVFDRPPQTAADKAADKAKQLADSENIKETADNTEEMVDALRHMSTQPSVQDDQALLTGSTKTPSSGKGFKAAAAAIEGALAVAGEKPPPKKGRAPRGDKFMDDDEAQFNRSDLVKARNAWRRNQMRTANAPFGQMGISGPMGVVGGKPIIDPATGKLKGFTGSRKSNFGMGPVRVKKAMTTAQRKAAYEAWKAKKASEAAARKAAREKKDEAWRKKHKLPPKKKPGEKPAEVKPLPASDPEMQYMPKPEPKKESPLPASDPEMQYVPQGEGGKDGGGSDAAKAATEAGAKLQEAIAKQAELNAALNTLAEIQADAADGQVTLTAEQLTALTKVTEAVGNVAQAMVETQGKIPEIMGKFADEINKKIQELKDQAKKMEAALGL